MVLLDPFYGVSDKGKTLARWLNRILIIYEVATIVGLIILYHKTFDELPLWLYFAMPVAGLILMHIANLIVRGIWNVVLAFVYGTTDAEEIVANAQLRAAKREMKRRRREDMKNNR